MISTSDFKKGARFEHEGAPWQVMEVSVHSPSARGAATLVKAKSRNLKTGQVLLKTFKSGELFQVPDLTKNQVQFLYDQGDDVVFMDQETYDQYALPKSSLEDALPWLAEGVEIQLLRYNGEVINLELPQSLEMKVTTVESGARGDTASGKVQSKVILENGVTIMAPTYVKEGSMIKVDPSEGVFLGRV